MASVYDYENYKRKLDKMNLKPKEYARLLREWCKKTSFEEWKMDIVMFYLIGEKMGFGLSYWLIYSLFLIIKFFKWCVAVAKVVEDD